MSIGPLEKPTDVLMNMASKLLQLLTNNHLKKYHVFNVCYLLLYWLQNGEH